MKLSQDHDEGESPALNAEDVLGFIAHSGELEDSRKASGYDHKVRQKIISVLGLGERAAEFGPISSFAEFAAAFPDVPVRFGADRVRHAISFRDIATLFKKPTTTTPWKAYASAREIAEAESKDVNYFAFVFELVGVGRFMAIHDYPRHVVTETPSVSWFLGSGRFRRKYTLEPLDALLAEIR